MTKVNYSSADYPREVEDTRHLEIPLADGTRLAARLWRPAGAGPEARVPVVLEYLPYRKRDTTARRDSLIHPYFAGHGIAAARVDIRGTGDSDGTIADEYTAQELADALEVIAWLAAQPWCNGNVGMMGISWGGFNSLQVAALRPPALKAIITACSTDDRYADDVHYMGGCLINENVEWSGEMFGRNGRPPDPALVGERWRQMWLDRLAANRPWGYAWLAHQTRDSYWKHGSVCEDFSRITVPTLALHGWGDGYSNSAFRLLSGMTSPVWAVVGQWTHTFPHMARPGPAIGFLQHAVRWWDRWLNGVDNGIDREPALQAMIQHPYPPVSEPAEITGKWVSEPSWPSDNIAMRTFHLGDGRLLDAPGPEAEARIDSLLVPGFYGRWCGYGRGGDYPTDQREIDGSALVFDTAPLPEAVDLLGAPVVQLDVRSEAPSAMIAARLSMIAPSGEATRITYTILNLTHRDGHETPKPLKPVTWHRVRLALNELGQTVPAGYRIRLALSDSFWPLAWPSPVKPGLVVRTGTATLALPVRASRDGDGAMPMPADVHMPVGDPVTVEGDPRETRVVTQDIVEGRTVLHVHVDSAKVVHDETGWFTRAAKDERYEIAREDPLSARTEIVMVVTTGRGDWETEVRTRSVLTATEREYRLTAEMAAYENGALVVEREWDEAFPRQP